MALEKGTEAWMFWSEFFQFCKKYWEVKEDEEYWEGMAKDADGLYAKYNSIYAKHLLIAFCDAQDEAFKLKKETGI